MPKITPATTRSKAFQDAVARIVEYRKFPPKKILRIVKWSKAINKATDEVQELYHKVLKKHAELDEFGNFVPKDGRAGTWKLKDEISSNPDKMKIYCDDLEEFNTMEIDVEVMPLNFSEVDKVELNPAEIEALEPLLVMDA